MIYLPRCCFVRQTNAGDYEVCHAETSTVCKHRPSGGRGGKPDGVTPCNRIIGHGKTITEARRNARYCFEGLS
jgi:hypothetical protein